MKKLLGVGAVAVLVLAACGKSSNAPSSTGNHPGGVATLTVNTRNAAGVGTVLVDAKGLTLYHLKTESGSTIQCTGSCASTWPPLLFSGNGSPTGGSHVTGALATVKRPDGGTQVTYMGMTLYTYAGDSAPGQAHGQGIQGVWFAVTPSGLSSSGGGGGYHYGGSSPSSGGGY